MFANNYAYSEGGVLAIDHPTLIINIANENENRRQLWGLREESFYVQSVEDFKLDSAILFYNNGTNGRVLYSTANNALFSIRDSILISEPSIDLSLAENYFSNYSSIASTSFSFIGTDTFIYCINNHYENSYLNERGGVFYLD